MNAAPIKTISRVFSEDQIPDAMQETIQRIKAEYKATQPVIPTKPVTPAKPEPIGIATNARPEFLEPISPVGIVSPMDSRKMLREYEQKNMKEYFQWEVQQPSTWLKQIEVFENQRSKITRKGTLSARNIKELDELDEKIEYCENALAELEDDYFEDSE
jgi:hypothetical protein